LKTDKITLLKKMD